MANPAGVHRYMPEEAIDRARHVRLFLTNSSVLFTSAAASIVIYATVINPSASHALIGFVVFILGVSLALLAPVADQFPAAARIAVAVAVALRAYLFGGN
uniref:Uncharacterized protein n=1 Tax=Oryza punctata TaxID=4537 RepID=A0A0E0LEL7_ORYPU